MGILPAVILSLKITSLTCLIISIYSYHWFQIDDYSANKNTIQDLCTSYGAFCAKEDQMPLPRLIVITPCVFLILSLLLEIINNCLSGFNISRAPSLLNCFLEQTSAALSCAITIHCLWVTAVHIRIAIGIRIVHLEWSFLAFGLATVLVPIDAMCSMIRITHHCQKQSRTTTHRIISPCRHKAMVDCIL